MRKYAYAKRFKILNAWNFKQAWRCEISRDITWIRSRFKCEDQKVNIFKDLQELIYNIFCEARKLLSLAFLQNNTIEPRLQGIDGISILYCILGMTKLIDALESHLIHTLNQRCSWKKCVPQISMIDQIYLFFIPSASAI